MFMETANYFRLKAYAKQEEESDGSLDYLKRGGWRISKHLSKVDELSRRQVDERDKFRRNATEKDNDR